MRASTPEVLFVDGRTLVEARTAAEALSVVADELGPSARVLSVDTVTRGGVGGFFARELVQVIAEAAEPGGPDHWDGTDSWAETADGDGWDDEGWDGHEHDGDGHDGDEPLGGDAVADAPDADAWRSAVAAASAVLDDGHLAVGRGAPGHPGAAMGPGAVTGDPLRGSDPFAAMVAAANGQDGPARTRPGTARSGRPGPDGWASAPTALPDAVALDGVGPEHAGGTSPLGDRVVVEVTDAAGGTPEPASAAEQAEHADHVVLTTPPRPLLPRRAPELVGSPMAIALDRLLVHGDDDTPFGTALRAELARTGWTPADGPPSRRRVRRIWSGPVTPTALAARPAGTTVEDAAPRDALRDVVARAVSQARDDAPAGADASVPVVERPAHADAADSTTQEDGPVGGDGLDTGDWAATLRQRGVPADVIERAEREHASGAAVHEALAHALAPLCGRLVGGDAVYAGPGSGRVPADRGGPDGDGADGAGADGAGADVGDGAVRVVSPDEIVLEPGDVRLVIDDSAAGRAALAWQRDGRWLCVVAGAGSWHALLRDDPEAVTWSSPEALPAAVAAASSHGLPLAPPARAGGDTTPADPAVIAHDLLRLTTGGVPAGPGA